MFWPRTLKGQGYGEIRSPRSKDRLMKKLVLLLTIGVGVLLSGCGTVDSFDERVRRYNNILELESRMAVDDIDEILLFDRSTYLSRWKAVIGH